MKCSNPQCNHGVGLVSYRRGVFTKGRYCSKECGDSYVIERAKPAVRRRTATTYFEWLFLQPGGSGAVLQAKGREDAVRMRSRRDWNAGCV